MARRALVARRANREALVLRVSAAIVPVVAYFPIDRDRAGLRVDVERQLLAVLVGLRVEVIAVPVQVPHLGIAGSLDSALDLISRQILGGAECDPGQGETGDSK